MREQSRGETFVLLGLSALECLSAGHRSCVCAWCNSIREPWWTGCTASLSKQWDWLDFNPPYGGGRSTLWLLRSSWMMVETHSLVFHAPLPRSTHRLLGSSLVCTPRALLPPSGAIFRRVEGRPKQCPSGINGCSEVCSQRSQLPSCPQTFPTLHPAWDSPVGIIAFSVLTPKDFSWNGIF